MLHRVREAWADLDPSLLQGPVEADESYVGGFVKNMNAKRRAKLEEQRIGRGNADKTTVMAIVERTSLIVRAGPKLSSFLFAESRFLQGGISKQVTSGSEAQTDGFPAYRGLKRDYVHQVIDHAHEYVRGHVHTNSIESFFSAFKRTIRGTYIASRPKHLDRYVAEQVYRFNERDNQDGPTLC